MRDYIDVLPPVPPKSEIVANGCTYYIKGYVNLLTDTITRLNELVDELEDENEQLRGQLNQIHKEENGI